MGPWWLLEAELVEERAWNPWGVDESNSPTWEGLVTNHVVKCNSPFMKYSPREARLILKIKSPGICPQDSQDWFMICHKPQSSWFITGKVKVWPLAQGQGVSLGRAKRAAGKGNGRSTCLSDQWLLSLLLGTLVRMKNLYGKKMLLYFVLSFSRAY